MNKKILISIESKLKQRITESSDNFAVFDFDNTCIVNDVGDALFSYVCRNNLLKDSNLLGDKPLSLQGYSAAVFNKYHDLLAEQRTQLAYEYFNTCFSGFTNSELDKLTLDLIEYEGDALVKDSLFGIDISRGIKKRDEIERLFKFLSENSISIWIVSASPKQAIVTAFEYYFPGFEANIIGMESELVNEKLTKKLILPTSTFEGKVENIKQKIHESIRPILAVGDSTNDKAMLEYGQIPVVINRGNNLTDLAKERGWFLID